jgi:16S rRNA (uracil1498-N3)-methyltransferase
LSRRVRLAVSELGPGELTLPAEAVHYLVRVHRLRSGDVFLAFDPERGLEGEVELVLPSERRALGRVRALRPAALQSVTRVSLLQGFGKADKIDQIVRDATALMVSKIVVVETERSVVRLTAADSERTATRHARWRKIALEAARQSGRSDVPAILGPAPLASALSEHAAEHPVRWCCDPRAELSLGDVLASWDPASPTLVLVGPEGGLSEDELAGAAHAGLIPVRLGPLTLRTETAALVVLGSLFTHAEIKKHEYGAL